MSRNSRAVIDRDHDDAEALAAAARHLRRFAAQAQYRGVPIEPLVLAAELLDALARSTRAGLLPRRQETRGLALRLAEQVLTRADPALLRHAMPHPRVKQSDLPPAMYDSRTPPAGSATAKRRTD